MEKHTTIEDERAVPGEGEGPGGDAPLTGRRLIALLLGPALAVLLLLLPAPEGLKPEAWRLVALVAWMVVWWLGEAVPIPATALLPIPMMPLFGVQEMKSVTQGYAHPLVFLVLGGFILAGAMQRWGLHRRIALTIVSLVGTHPASLIGGFMLATAFLSMWISNTATTIMMFAVGLSVVEFISAKSEDASATRRFGVALLLGIAYAASIGGVGTLIGTPPNALLASFLASNYKIEIDFITWMMFGLPVVFIMLPIAWALLTRVIFRVDENALGDAGSVIAEEVSKLGDMSRGERVVLIVFVLTALSWMLRKQIVAFTGLAINDTSIAMIAALALFSIPLSRARGTFALDWEVARHVPWGVLILFGGGLALAGAFKSTGLAEAIGGSVAGLSGVNIWLIVFATAAAIIFLTEITSNTASTATFLPVLGAVAVGLGQSPLLLAAPVAVGASMAFMMPVATPPNAIVFSYKGMTIEDMARAGFWLNLIAVLVTFLAVFLLARPIFGITVG